MGRHPKYRLTPEERQRFIAEFPTCPDLQALADELGMPLSTLRNYARHEGLRREYHRIPHGPKKQRTPKPKKPRVKVVPALPSKTTHTSLNAMPVPAAFRSMMEARNVSIGDDKTPEEGCVAKRSKNR